MNVLLILQALQLAQQLRDYAIQQASLAKQNGEFTDAQLEQISAMAGVSDANWDAEVVAAKNRLSANG